MGEYSPPADGLDGRGLRVAVVAARFNDHITKPLLDGALGALRDAGVEEDVPVHWVPGAFELPIVTMRLAASHGWDAIVCLGAVIRGDTPHFEYVAGECAAGIMRVALDTGVPCAFGILTTEDLDQALARSEAPGGENAGEEGARTAVEMAKLVAAIAGD